MGKRIGPPTFNVNKLYESIVKETNSYIENFGKINESQYTIFLETSIYADSKEDALKKLEQVVGEEFDYTIEEVIEESKDSKKKFNIKTKVKKEIKEKVENWIKNLKEDIEATIKADDKEINITEVPGGVQTTVIDKEKGDQTIDRVETITDKSEEEKEEKPVDEGKLPKDPTDATKPETIKALNEDGSAIAAADGFVKPEEKEVESDGGSSIPEVTPEFIDQVISEVPGLGDYNKIEVEAGLKVELEHFASIKGDTTILGNIVLDHLKEFPGKSYYGALAQMEHELKETPEEEKAEHTKGGSEGPASGEVPAGESQPGEIPESKKKIKENIDSLIDTKPILTDALKSVGYDVTEYSIADKEAGEVTITVKVKNKEEAEAVENSSELSTEQPPVENVPVESESTEVPSVEKNESKQTIKETVSEEEVDRISKELGVDKETIKRISKELEEGKLPKDPTDATKSETIKALNEQEKVEPGVEEKVKVIAVVSDSEVADSIVKDNENKGAFKRENSEKKWEVCIKESKKVEMSKEEISERIELVRHLKEQKELTDKEKKFVKENQYLLK